MKTYMHHHAIEDAGLSHDDPTIICVTCPPDVSPTFEELLADPHGQYDVRGEVLPHLLAFGPPVEIKVERCHCASVHVGRCEPRIGRLPSRPTAGGQPSGKPDPTS